MARDGTPSGGRPPGSLSPLTKELNNWFEQSLLGAESEFEEHPVYRLLRIGYNQVKDCNDKGQIQDVPVVVQVKALETAMKYIRSPAAAKLEVTGRDGEPLHNSLELSSPEDVRIRLEQLTEQVNQLVNMKVISEQ